MHTRSDAAIDLNPHYLQEVLRILSLYIPDIEVRAFGSRVKWTAKAYSDLDLALMTEMPLSLEQEAQLREAFDESTLPFKVDFVDWAAASKTFQSIISADSVVICPAGRQPSDEKWSVMPLEEALDALLDYRGKTPEKTNFGVPLITAKIVKNGRIEPATEFIARDKYTGWMTRGLPRVGDVLLTTEAPLGEVAQLHTDYVALAQRLVALRGKAGVMDNTYLRYLLQTDDIQEQLSARATGTTVLGIKQSELRKIAVRLPSIERQREVAAMLALLDDRITLLRETNATLEAIAQVLFKSWFVDFDPVRAKMEGRVPEGMDEATAALFPDSFEESVLGEVPRGWAIESLDKIANYLNGLALQKFPPTGADDLPVIKIAQLRKGDTVGADKASRCIKPEYIVQDGDVLFSWSGSLEVEIWCGGEGALNQHLFKVSSTNYPKWFFYLWTKYHLEYFRQVAASKATTMGHIQRSHLSDAKCFVPSTNVLLAGDQVLHPIIDCLVEGALQAAKLSELRDTLLPRLISGQLRLPEVQSQLEEVLG